MSTQEEMLKQIHSVLFPVKKEKDSDRAWIEFYKSELDKGKIKKLGKTK